MSENTYVLYRFFDKNRDLLYVGRTANPGNRITKHEITKDWWREVDTITLEHFNSSIEQAESNAISNENPKYNVSGHPYRRYIDKIVAYLRNNREKHLSRNEILNMLGRNLSSAQMDVLHTKLLETNLVSSYTIPSGPKGGRPATYYGLIGDEERT